MANAAAAPVKKARVRFVVPEPEPSAFEKLALAHPHDRAFALTELNWEKRVNSGRQLAAKGAIVAALLVGARALQEDFRWFSAATVCAAVITCGAAASFQMRHSPEASEARGFELLERGDAAGAEKAFGWAYNSNAGCLGLAEARRLQGKWSEANWALLRMRRPTRAQSRICGRLAEAIQARDSAPLLHAYGWYR